MKKFTSVILIFMSVLLVFTGCTGATITQNEAKADSPLSEKNNAADKDLVFDNGIGGGVAPEGEYPAEGGAAYPEVGSPTPGGEPDFNGNVMPPSTDIIENTYFLTSQTPKSTFSADVDTASYALFRKLVNQGNNAATIKSYAKSSIRTEEMINYFDYNYEGPQNGELFGVNVQISDCPWNDSKLLVLGLQTEKTAPLTANNLVFLIDVSGSMQSSDKLELIKRSFSQLVDKLGEDDRVSIVTYSGNEKVVLEGCEGNKHAQIMDAVNSLEARGSTNGEAGIKMAYQIAEKYMIAGGNNRIILASDGDLNVGISSPEELEALISEKKDSGVYLSVLGFGTGNYRDNNMETLADSGNGIYYYIDGETEAEKVFGSDLFSTLYTVAEDVKLQIEFNPEYVEKYRLVGYENRILNEEDFENDRKDAGELGAGHSVTVCYELVMTDSALEAESEWFTLSVRHKKAGAEVSTLDEYKIGVECHTLTPDDNFKFICSVIETSLMLRDSEYLGNGIDFEHVINNLKSLKLTDYYKQEFLSLLEKYTGVE